MRVTVESLPKSSSEQLAVALAVAGFRTDPDPLLLHRINCVHLHR